MKESIWYDIMIDKGPRTLICHTGTTDKDFAMWLARAAKQAGYDVSLQERTSKEETTVRPIAVE